MAFVSRYAMSSPAEDRAESFSWLVLEPEAVRRAAASDRALSAKLELLERTVVQAVPQMQALFDETRQRK